MSMLDQESLRQAILSEIVGSPPLPRGQRVASYRSIVARAEKAAARDGTEARGRRAIVNSVYEQCADVEYEVFGGVLERREIIADFRRPAPEPEIEYETEDEYEDDDNDAGEFEFDFTPEIEPAKNPTPSGQAYEDEYIDDEDDEEEPEPEFEPEPVRPRRRRRPPPEFEPEPDTAAGPARTRRRGPPPGPEPLAPNPQIDGERPRRRPTPPGEQMQAPQERPLRRKRRPTSPSPVGEPVFEEPVAEPGPNQDESGRRSVEPDLGIGRGRSMWTGDHFNEAPGLKKKRRRGGAIWRFLITFLIVAALAGGAFFAWETVRPGQPRQLLGLVSDAIFGEGGIIATGGPQDSAGQLPEEGLRTGVPGRLAAEPNSPAAAPQSNGAPQNNAAPNVRVVGEPGAAPQPGAQIAGAAPAIETAATQGPLPAAVQMDIAEFQFLPNEAHTLARTEDGQSITISSVAPFGTLPADRQGSWLVINNANEQALSGRRVRVTVSVKAAAVNGSDSFAVNYLTVGSGAGGWRLFPLFPDYVDFTFEYDIPDQPQSTESVDLLGFNADLTGAGRTIDLRSVRIEPLS